MNFSKDIKIAIIGSEGYVGKAMTEFFKNHYEIIKYDIALKEKCATKSEANLATLSVICVPTPSLGDGSCDISIVEKTVKWLETTLILIKSTIEPGTSDKLKEKYRKRIVFSPEYIGESAYYNPLMKSPIEEPFVILGGDEKDTQEIFDILMPIIGPLKNTYQCPAKEAEMVKYFSNVSLALKTGYANEMRKICERAGVNYYRVRDLWLADPRVNQFQSIAFKNSRGFSGHCLPKDLRALVKWAEKLSYKPPIIMAIKEWIIKN